MREAVEAAHYRTALICDDRMFHYGPNADLLVIPRLSVYGGKHTIRVESVDPASGLVTVSNDGAPLPLKAVVRDPGTGRILTESRPLRVGPQPCQLKTLAPFPADAAVELRDAKGLFHYPPVP